MVCFLPFLFFSHCVHTKVERSSFSRILWLLDFPLYHPQTKNANLGVSMSIHSTAILGKAKNSSAMGFWEAVVLERNCIYIGTWRLVYK